MKRWFVILVATSCSLLGAVPALATQPGTNGKIAFWAFNRGKVQAVEPDGTGRILIADNTAGPAPAWSPDGSEIAYVSSAPRQDQSLMVAGADGSNPTEVVGAADGVGWMVTPSWSADGTQIAVIAHLKGSKGGHVTIVDVATGAETQIGPDTLTRYDGLDWSPTGTIAFLTGYTSDLFTMQPDGTGQTQIKGHYLFSPSWSPDGTRLAACRWGGKHRTDLMTMNPDGSGRAWITDTPHRWEWTPAWSPDGMMIAFSRTQTGSDTANDDIWVAAADGSGAHQITDTAHLDEFELDWQPLP